MQPGADAGAPLGDSVVLAGRYILVEPHSRGDVRLANPDPDDPPAVYPSHLTPSEDVERLRDGIRYMLSIFSEPGLATLTRAADGIPTTPEPCDLTHTSRMTPPLTGTRWVAHGWAWTESIIDPTATGVDGVENLLGRRLVILTITRGSTQNPRKRRRRAASKLILRAR